MDTIDYLTNNLEKPLLALFNSKVTDKGISPELLIIKMGFIIPPVVDLVDRDNNLVCQINLSPLGIGELAIQTELYLKQKIELIITERYYEFSLF